MKTLFKKNENVTVLKFAEHFSSGMIHETMIELSKKQAAKTAFCDCIAIKIPSKEVDDSVRIGLVLVKEGALTPCTHHRRLLPRLAKLQSKACIPAVEGADVRGASRGLPPRDPAEHCGILSGHGAGGGTGLGLGAR